MLELLQILNATTMDQHRADMVVWKWTANGKYSVRSYYHTFTQYPTILDSRASIWGIKALHRVMVFVWLMLRRRILTVDNLVRRGWHLPNRCCLCKRAEETMDHLFRDCNYTLALRAIIISFSRTAGCIHFQNNSYWQAILNSRYKEIKRLQIVICFVTWKERCRRIFSDQQKPPTILAMEITSEYNSWFPGTGH